MVKTRNLMAIVCGVILALVFAAVFLLNAYIPAQPIPAKTGYSQIEP